MLGFETEVTPLRLHFFAWKKQEACLKEGKVEN